MKLRFLFSLSWLVTFAVSASPVPTPGFVQAVDQAPTTTSVPALEPAQWLLAHLDVETTGLVPGYHEMIDAGWV